MAQNVRFHYLYRDSGNYKKFGFKDFSNPLSLSVDEVNQLIKSRLIDSEFFYPQKVGIKKFRFHRFQDNYSWYEFEMVEMVISRKPKQSINEFLNLLEQSML